MTTSDRYPGCECPQVDYDEGYEGPAPCGHFVPMEGRAYRNICKSCDHYRDCHKADA